MNNIYINEIIEIMKDFEDIHSPKDYQFSDHVELGYREIPIEPDLMYYLFKHILGFNTKRRIYEKVDYVIEFKYMNSFARLGHYKMSYRLSVEKHIKDEILDTLTKVNVLLEKALLQFSIEAVKCNLYSLPNYYEMYYSKIRLLERKLEEIKASKFELISKFRELEENLISSGKAYERIEIPDGKWTIIETPIKRLHDDLQFKTSELDQVFSYTTEYYIECWFSFLDHLSSLLFPMTSNFDRNKEYSEYLKLDWRAKIERIFGANSKGYSALIEKLSYIKEVYRNRFSHGMFSREKEIHVQLKDFGMYPLWIGKKIRGFDGTSNVLNNDIYIETKGVFDKVIKLLEDQFPLPLNIIKSNIPTYLDQKFYGDALNNPESNTKYIETYWYLQDNQSNMDW